MDEPNVCIGSMLERGEADGGNFKEDMSNLKSNKSGIYIIALLTALLLIFIILYAVKDKFYGGDPVNEWNLSNLLYYQKPNGVIGGPQ
jgi:hypothetical protein